MVPILQNKMRVFCECYRSVNFAVRDTVTIPCLIVVRNTVAVRLGTQKACSRLQLLAPSKKCSLFKQKGLPLLLLLSLLHTFVCAQSYLKPKN